MSVGAPRVAGFDDLEVIGRGGFSTVYSAVQEDLGRRVAIKVLNFDVAEGAAQRRFERECKVVGILSGVPGIVSVHQSAFADDGRPCIVMQFMEGGTLQSHVRSGGPLGFEDARELTASLADALAAAHARDVVHRDIKPGNVLLTADGCPALADFGIATVANLASSSQTVESLSPPFAPPERLLGGEIDEKLADIYSLGATISFALTGVAPFGTAESGGVSGLVHRVLKNPPPELRGHGLPDEFADLITQMLDKRPDSRPPSASEVGRRVQDMSKVSTSKISAAAAPATPMPRQHGSPGVTDADDASVEIPPVPSTPGAVRFSLDPLGSHGDHHPPPYNPPMYPDSHLGSAWQDDEDVDSGVWPTAVDYVRAIQDRSTLLDGDLASATVQEDMLGMPVSAAGQSAVVFHVHSDEEAVAVRFFTRPPRDGRVRYRALAEHMADNPCGPVVSARWVESAIDIDDHERPAVWMPWAEGRPLNLLVEDLLDDPLRLESLAMTWLDVLDALRRSGMAHGDLQNGNILVSDDLVVSLVDLDGIWVPALHGRPPAETGHLCFQHRARSIEHWGPEMDTFPGLLIFTSLLALAADPQLWRFHQGENLILDAADLRQPGTSDAWGAMAASPSPLVRTLTSSVQVYASAPSPPDGSVRDLVEACGGTDVSTLRARTKTAPSVAAATDASPQPAVSQAGSDWWHQAAHRSGSGAASSSDGAVGIGMPQEQAGSVWAGGSGAATTGTVPATGGAQPAAARRGLLARNHVASGLVVGFVAGVLACAAEAAAVNLFDVNGNTSLLVLSVTAVTTFCGVLSGLPELFDRRSSTKWARVVLGAATACGVVVAVAIVVHQAQESPTDGSAIGVVPMMLCSAFIMGGCLGLVGAIRSLAEAMTLAAAGLVGGALMVLPIWSGGIDFDSEGSMVLNMGSPGGPVSVIAAMMLLGLVVGSFKWVVERASASRTSARRTPP